MKDYTQTTLFVVPFSNGTLGSSTYSDGNLSFNLTEYFHGQDNPNWREQVKKNEQAATTVTARRETAEYSFLPTHAVFHWNGDPITTDRHDCGNLGPEIAAWSSDIVQKAEADAWTNLMKSIRKTQSSYDGMVFLGEIGQTVTMLRNPLKAINEGFRWLYDRKYVTKVKQLRHELKDSRVVSGDSLSSFAKNPLVNGKTAAELVLQWNFGIVPLLNDLQGMMRAIDAAPLSGKTRVRGYGEAKNESSADYGASSSGVIAVSKSGQFTSSVKVIYTAGITEEVTVPDTVKRALGRGNFELLNVPVALYELIPWSFLLDYVSNVGDVLSSVFTSRRDVKWIVRSEIRTWKGTMLCTPKPGASYALTQQGYASITVTVRTFNRTLVPVDVVKLPPVYWELPKYARQYVNMAALARLLVR